MVYGIITGEALIQRFHSHCVHYKAGVLKPFAASDPFSFKIIFMKQESLFKCVQQILWYLLEPESIYSLTVHYPS